MRLYECYSIETKRGAENAGVTYERLRISFAIYQILIYNMGVGIVVREVRMDKVYTIDEIKNISVPIAQRYGVKAVYLFGSYARNEADENSDIDIVIDKGKIQGLQFVSFTLDLEDRFGKRVDVLTTYSLPDDLRQEILSDEVLLYAEK